MKGRTKTISAILEKALGGWVEDPRSPLDCGYLLSLPGLCFLTPLQLEELTLSLFLNPLPVCLSCHLSSLPNPFPSRIADKAFYQQPDADIIGYVYVCPLCSSVWGSWREQGPRLWLTVSRVSCLWGLRMQQCEGQ